MVHQHPSIETNRLLLNAPAYTDVPVIVKHANNENVIRNTLNMPFPYFERDAIGWINKLLTGYQDGSRHAFAIRTKVDQVFIGGIGLNINVRFNHAELGYWIGEDFWNKGYMTEALSAVLRYGFTKVGLQKIFASHIIENPSSGKVMTKNGMIYEGTLKDHTRKDGIYQTLVQYRLTKEEYQQLQL